jgi:hypothetical protein
MAEEVKIPIPVADNYDPTLTEAAKTIKKKKKKKTKKAPKVPKAPKAPKFPKAKKAPKVSKERIAELLAQFTDEYKGLVLKSLKKAGTRKELEDFLEHNNKSAFESYSKSKNDTDLALGVTKLVIAANYNKVLRDLLYKEAKTGVLQLEEKERVDPQTVESHAQFVTRNPRDEDLKQIGDKYPDMKNRDKYIHDAMVLRGKKTKKATWEEFSESKDKLLIGSDELSDKNPEVSIIGKVDKDVFYFDPDYIDFNDINQVGTLLTLYNFK